MESKWNTTPYRFQVQIRPVLSQMLCMVIKGIFLVTASYQHDTISTKVAVPTPAGETFTMLPTRVFTFTSAEMMTR